MIRGDVHDKLLRIRDKVYRIASESLRKAVTHAQARHITVTIRVRCQRGACTEIELRVAAAIAYSTPALASSRARWLSRWSGRSDV